MDAGDWDLRHAAMAAAPNPAANRFLVEEASALPAGSALDLACGRGRNAVWLAERGWEVTGVDFSAVALDAARALAESRGVRVEWTLADLRAHRPPERGHDLVAVLYLQLPAGERGPVLARAAGAVAPGGLLLVVAHDVTNPAEGYGGPSDPAVLYGPDEVLADIRGAGLAAERAERVRRPVVTEAGERVAIDALVRARRPPGRGR